MNWETIKDIYRYVLIYNYKIEYFGGDKYKLISFYPAGGKKWEVEYKNKLLHGKYMWWHENGIKYLEEEYKDGIQIK